MINCLSEELIRNAQDLRCIGIRELAWRYKLIPEVLNTLVDRNWALR
jgi:hypothetical protein